MEALNPGRKLIMCQALDESLRQPNGFSYIVYELSGMVMVLSSLYKIRQHHVNALTSWRSQCSFCTCTFQGGKGICNSCPVNLSGRACRKMQPQRSITQFIWFGSQDSSEIAHWFRPQDVTSHPGVWSAGHRIRLSIRRDQFGLCVHVPWLMMQKTRIQFPYRPAACVCPKFSNIFVISVKVHWCLLMSLCCMWLTDKHVHEL